MMTPISSLQNALAVSNLEKVPFLPTPRPSKHPGRSDHHFHSMDPRLDPFRNHLYLPVLARSLLHHAAL
jgi:hypothetical protein